MNKRLVTLTGPSCSGKSTLEKMLKKAGFASVISTTTREPRAGEVNGESYYFVEHDTFRVMSVVGQFAESVSFNGNNYGVTKAEFERVFATGKPVVAVVEPEGRKQLEEVAKQEGWDLLRVFVDVKPEVQAKRFLSRLQEESDPGLGIDLQTLEAYGRRLAVMMTTERAWVAEAHAGRSVPYDIVVPRFDADNDLSIIEAICKTVGHNLEVAA